MSLHRIHLTKLPKACGKQDLEDYFSSFGPIYSVKITLDKNKKSKGHGKVTVTSQDTFNTIMGQNHFLMGQ
jgi:RNA recognition motif-containing protein